MSPWCNPDIALCVLKKSAYSTEDVKRTCSGCRVCAELKPQFYRPTSGTLIKATQPMQRLSMGFKGQLSSASRNTYIFTILDKFSCFLFVFSLFKHEFRNFHQLRNSSTNSTPNKRFIGFQCRSSYGTSMPSWLMSPGPVLLLRFIHANTNDPLVDQVDPS